MKLLLVAGPEERIVLPGELVSPTLSLAGFDWSREVALIVDLGENRTGGYGVEVLGVDVTAPDKMEVRLRLTQPAPGAFVAQALTHPYALYPVPRAGLRPGPITVIARDAAGRELAREVVQL